MRRLKYVTEADLNGHFCIVLADLETTNFACAAKRWRKLQSKVLAILDRYAAVKERSS